LADSERSRDCADIGKVLDPYFTFSSPTSVLQVSLASAFQNHSVMDDYLMVQTAKTAELWQEQSQVSASQAFLAKLSLPYLQSPARVSAVKWLRKYSTELGTCSRTFQLAVSLTDLVFSQHNLQNFSGQQAVCAAALMSAVNTIETFEINADYLSQLPGMNVPARDIIQLQFFLLGAIDWALDLPTASDIVSYLSTVLAGTPERQSWEQWVDCCYQHSSMRFGPFIIAMAGYCALGGVRLEEADCGISVAALLQELEQWSDLGGEQLNSESRHSPNRPK